MPPTVLRAILRFGGIALVAAGQWLILSLEQFATVSFSADLYEYLKLDIPNLDNVLAGLVLVLLGMLLFGLGWLPAAQPAAESAPAPERLTLQIFGRERGKLALMGGLVGALLGLFGWLLLRLSQGDPDIWLGVVWLVCLALLLVLLLLVDRRSGAALAPGLARSEWLALAGLVALGLALGTYRLGNLPNSIVGDEGSFWDNALLIARGQSQPSPFGLGVYSYPVLSNYYQAAILRIFGLTMWSWRFSSVLAGVLALVPTYLLARELFGRRVALAAGLTLLGLPYMLAFERLGYNNIHALLPVAAALYLLYSGLRRESALYLGLGGIAGGLGFYTYTAGRLGAVVAVLFLLYLLARRLLRRPAAFGPASLRRLVLLGAIFGLAGVLTAYPQMVYSHVQDPNLSRYKLLESLFANAFYARDIFPDAELFRDHPPIEIDDQTFFYRPDLYGRLIARGAIRTLLAFHHSRLVFDHYIYGPLAGSASTVFYLLGLAAALAGLRRPEHVLLLLWFGSALVLLSMLNTFPPRYQHMVPVLPALAILIALGLTGAADLLAELLRARRLATAALALALASMLVSGAREYFVDVQNVYRASKDQVIAFVALDLREPRTLLYVYNTPEEQMATPWQITQMPTLATFLAVQRDSLAGGGFQLTPGQTYTIFYRPADRQVVEPFLERRLGHPIIPELYLSRQDDVDLASYTFTP